MLEAIYVLPWLDIAKPPGNQKKTKKTKTPSQNHSKTIEKTKKNRKTESSHTLWGSGLARMAVIIAEI